MANDDEFAWALTSGSYSDYRVLCICPSRAEAEALAIKIRGDGSVEWGPRREGVDLQAVALADSTSEPVENYSMTVNIWDDGSTSQPTDTVRREWPFDTLYGPPSAVSWRWVRAPIHKDKGGRLEVRGTDRERVRRVFSDRRAQLLAEDSFRSKREATGSR